ncbi:hypothetical protein PHYSODRAFT_523481 [Phytophthora sojae]|uniref:Uncharacterized protein n=1 Tax=Phytophthora sojae (strain P6497) TaxID=1094619 RepID=G5A550_PHYSP|nr:hypothetical protein PHYSODRAFT_523481 [Phytophthora sojae]EGZ09799.1 hypothetical protein PHYSODRAFT_523481 [Phytophthora sojae]|eukprot:XP_009534660.1 hypothetical protein PHYSODRAFT_523481 [Phytophthora sojae]
MSKPPSMLLRPPSGASSGVLYEPDAPQLQVNTRLSGSSGLRAPSLHSLRASSSPGIKRPSTIQQTKIVPPSTSVKLITPQMQFATDLKIEHKFAQCRLPSVSGSSQKHAARLLFAANNVADSGLLYRENELFSAHERALEAAWPQALVRVPYKLSSYSDQLDEGGSTASFVFPHRQRPASASGNKKGSDRSMVETDKYSSFDEAAQDFQRFVLSLPSSPSFSSQPMPIATTPGSKPLPPPHALSLREWLSNASRVFEGVRKASCFTAALRDHH